MAEQKKKPTVTNAAGYEEAKAAAQQGKPAIPQGSATGLRVGAVILWVLAFVFEILAVLILFGKLNITFMPTMWLLIILIVLDLACVILGSQLWKKANHIRPASEKNKALFWIWNNLGVIVACFAFLPLIVIMLSNKNLDKKTKVVATVAAVVALLIGGAASIDYNPISAEQQEAAMVELGAADVYWTPFGKVYHTCVDADADEYCPHLNRSEALTRGTVEQAIAAGRTRMCSWCAKHDGIDTSGILMDDGSTEAVSEALPETTPELDSEAEGVADAVADLFDAAA
ncbi:MAG: hypothetical protein K5990_04495 [Oscillospiraceae bacterium]|nr:hypothetical protein [Oscillospiraceae bacterium]